MVIDDAVYIRRVGSSPLTTVLADVRISPSHRLTLERGCLDSGPALDPGLGHAAWLSAVLRFAAWGGI